MSWWSGAADDAEASNEPREGSQAIVPPRAWLPSKRLVHTVRDEPFTDEQHTKIADVRSRIDTSNDVHHRFIEDDAMIARYLEARNWSVDAATDMLRETLAWRDEKGIWELATSYRDQISREGETGKSYRHGVGHNGEPVIYLRDRRQNTKTYAEQVLFTVHTLEAAVASMDRSRGVEQWILVIDMRGHSSENRPPMSTSREVLNIFQQHYPERLKRCVFVDAPWLFSTFWKLFKAFVDPKTKEKIAFCSGTPEEKLAVIGEVVPPEELEAPFGGERCVHYDHEVYFAVECEDVALLTEAGARGGKKKKKKDGAGGGHHRHHHHHHHEQHHHHKHRR